MSTGGHAVAQLVEVLRYKPEGRGFDCEMSRNLGASSSWNSLGLYRDCLSFIFTFTLTLNSLLRKVINTMRGQKVVFVTLSDGTYNTADL